MPVAPYGTWPSPIAVDVVVADAVGLGSVTTDGPTVWWVETRPWDGGRCVVVRAGPDGEPPLDVLPPPFSARSRVHEYGGGAYTVRDGLVWFVEDSDQRVWRLDPGGEPHPLTPEPPAPRSVRHADLACDPSGRWVACVRERHEGGGPTAVHNELVAVPAEGGADAVVLACGHDFYAAPRWSPDGRRLAWLTWDHPDMPWDATELWVADVIDGAVVGVSLGAASVVAGGDGESVSQPRWSPTGELHWISDRTGWWNLYAESSGGRRALVPMEAEFSGPDWQLGQATYSFLPGGSVAAVWRSGGRDHIGLIGAGIGGPGQVRELDTPFTEMSAVHALESGGVAVLAASPTRASAVVVLDPETGDRTVLRDSVREPLPPAAVSVPDHITFATDGSAGEDAHAQLYRPRLDGWAGLPGELPPLLVLIHGGPTGAASSALSGRVQFWTSRGFAVVDVDHRGSSGYGRAYRRGLEGRWGVADVEDCVAVGRHLAASGLVDGDRMTMRGGSAGGFTVLCALAFHDAFAAGTSAYGISDLAALAADTHKFESRYLDRLVGPWPESEDLYRERSPLYAADRIRAPLLMLQGLDDKVVPPSQSEALAAALRANGVPHAYVAFEGEQHGFRLASTQRRALEAELSFLGQVLGFAPSGEGAAVAIEGF